ncbi:DNA-deoxyinosine glycosylase [Fredinandcohnia quinoae]|uniref:DNA-deoxyinosine glycosylase n=1 Tax=Fredinandcohnia quinoae TaxID=2918902 RepID=A0AAW5EB26_9BACI|nr:DNA-deoxyinosine glycosylase [Fredinandcohnia sp. SECRCQ15]MCH1626875.1 DNA-deoxyinosine glycosylase [Fredinandcohnia sp. SECRCQ15]
MSNEQSEELEKIVGLDAVFGKDARVLILGSMPGAESLRISEYYGNKRNHFWKIMYSLFGQAELTNYEEKMSFLKEHKIALWDVIHSCNRKGSLDSNIKNEEPNDIPELLKSNPSIKLIACNGTKSFATFKKYFGGHTFDGIDIIKLSSSSPVPGKYNKTVEGKIEEWRVIKEYL